MHIFLFPKIITFIYLRLSLSVLLFFLKQSACICRSTTAIFYMYKLLKKWAKVKKNLGQIFEKITFRAEVFGLVSKFGVENSSKQFHIWAYIWKNIWMKKDLNGRGERVLNNKKYVNKVTGCWLLFIVNSVGFKFLKGQNCDGNTLKEIFLFVYKLQLNMDVFWSQESSIVQ